MWFCLKNKSARKPKHGFLHDLTCVYHRFHSLSLFTAAMFTVRALVRICCQESMRGILDSHRDWCLSQGNDWYESWSWLESRRLGLGFGKGLKRVDQSSETPNHLEAAGADFSMMFRSQMLHGAGIFNYMWSIFGVIKCREIYQPHGASVRTREFMQSGEGERC